MYKRQVVGFPVSVERFTPVIFHGLYLAQVVLVFSLCAASGDLEHGVFAGIVASGFYRCACLLYTSDPNIVISLPSDFPGGTFTLVHTWD